MSKKYPFTFGRMVVDKKHQFMGVTDPSVFVIADMWSKEENGDTEVWVDHYRGHVELSYEELRNTDRYEQLGLVDPTKSVLEQCKQAETDWLEEQSNE